MIGLLTTHAGDGLRRRFLRRSTILALLMLAALIRFSYVVPLAWQFPYECHHTDENTLPYEAIAAWEGVAPQEIGWPASTYRWLLTITYSAYAAPDIVASGRTFPEISHTIETWTAAKIADAVPLYQIGRALSALIGVGFVGVVYFAVDRRVSFLGGASAALFAAISPIAVNHSQYILADMLGALFCMGSLAVKYDGTTRDTGRAVAAGVCLGLATASKNHFALWALPAAVRLWTGSGIRLGNRGDMLVYSRRLCIMATVMIAAYILLVPYCLLNPVLFAKEVVAVVGSKVVGDGNTSGFLNNLKISFSNLWNAPLNLIHVL